MSMANVGSGSEEAVVTFDTITILAPRYGFCLFLLAVVFLCVPRNINVFMINHVLIVGGDTMLSFICRFCDFKGKPLISKYNTTVLFVFLSCQRIFLSSFTQQRIFTTHNSQVDCFSFLIMFTIGHWSVTTCLWELNLLKMNLTCLFAYAVQPMSYLCCCSPGPSYPQRSNDVPTDCDACTIPTMLFRFFLSHA